MPQIWLRGRTIAAVDGRGTHHDHLPEQPGAAAVVLHFPQGWEYRAYWAGTSPAPPMQRAGNDEEWTLRALPAIGHEAMSPSPWALSARMELAYLEPGESVKNAASWEMLGGMTSSPWAQSNPIPELSEKARQLTTQKTDFDGKVRALAAFLPSEIR